MSDGSDSVSARLHDYRDRLDEGVKDEVRHKVLLTVHWRKLEFASDKPSAQIAMHSPREYGREVRSTP